MRSRDQRLQRVIRPEPSPRKIANLDRGGGVFSEDRVEQNALDFASIPLQRGWRRWVVSSRDFFYWVGVMTTAGVGYWLIYAFYEMMRKVSQ